MTFVSWLAFIVNGHYDYPKVFGLNPAQDMATFKLLQDAEFHYYVIHPLPFPISWSTVDTSLNSQIMHLFMPEHIYSEQGLHCIPMTPCGSRWTYSNAKLEDSGPGETIFCLVHLMAFLWGNQTQLSRSQLNPILKGSTLKERMCS